jgi:hypothetical protein
VTGGLSIGQCGKVLTENNNAENMGTFIIKEEDLYMLIIQVYELKFLMDLVRNGGKGLPKEYICLYNARIKEVVMQLMITWNKVEQEQKKR